MNIVLALLIAGLTLGGATLASNLAATKSWHKWVFWGTALLSVCLIGVQAYFNDSDMKELKRQLNKIETNTEKPSTVQVLPQPEDKHTHLQYMNPGHTIQPDPPTLPLREKRGVNVNIGFYNSGKYVSRDCRSASAVYIEKPDTAATNDVIWERFESEKPLISCPDQVPVTVPANSASYTFRTEITRPLSTKDIFDLESGSLIIYAVGRATWSDDTGKYQTKFCTLMATNYPTSSSFAWHSCLANNSEERIY